MYEIGLSELRVTARYEDAKHLSIRYDAESATRPDRCASAKCGSMSPPHVHDTKPYLLRDVRAEGKLVFINLSVRRYKCPVCGSVFPEEYSFFSPRSHITNRLRDEFISRCIKGETFRYIANDYGVDPKTVAAAFNAYAEKHKDELELKYTPVILGIDEAHIDDHYRLVLTDIKKQRLLDIKKDNSKRTVKSYLRTLNKRICKVAAMDFAKWYATSVEEILPDTMIVIDKFHVIQLINRALDNVRKEISKDLRESGVDVRALKHSRKIFMANWEDLSPDSLRRMDLWFRDFPQLYEAYMCKETFRDIYHLAENVDDASRMYDLWLAQIPEFIHFETLKATMTERRDHVLNYWRCGWTNAYTESVNNQIKRIEKAGRGYKFATLRKRCLLEINAPKPDIVNPRTTDYFAMDGSPAPDINQKKDSTVIYIRNHY